ncbi:uncharacterized protein LOC144134196 [Amblyomma americanum]
MIVVKLHTENVDNGGDHWPVAPNPDGVDLTDHNALSLASIIDEVKKQLLDVARHGRYAMLSFAMYARMYRMKASWSKVSVRETSETSLNMDYAAVCKMKAEKDSSDHGTMYVADQQKFLALFDSPSTFKAKTKARLNVMPKNFTGLAVYNGEMDDSEDACGKGRFPRLRAIKRALAASPQLKEDLGKGGPGKERKKKFYSATKQPPPSSGARGCTNNLHKWVRATSAFKDNISTTVFLGLAAQFLRLQPMGDQSVVLKPEPVPAPAPTGERMCNLRGGEGEGGLNVPALVCGGVCLGFLLLCGIVFLVVFNRSWEDQGDKRRTNRTEPIIPEPSGGRDPSKWTYFGVRVGDLESKGHGVSGKVYAATAQVICLVDFNYDGAGSSAVFMVGTTDDPDDNGEVLRDLTLRAHVIPISNLSLSRHFQL